MRPLPTDHPEYFGRYINLVNENEITDAFATQDLILKEFLDSIPSDKWEYKYAEDKWTIKELIQHCIDAERIFGYRALCFARKETTSLPAFEENDYAENSGANKRSSESLKDEYITLRKSTEQLFNSFTDGMLAAQGTANENKISVLSLGYSLLGHFYHHKRILEERYLN